MSGTEPNRRHFMKMLGATFAGAAVGGFYTAAYADSMASLNARRTTIQELNPPSEEEIRRVTAILKPLFSTRIPQQVFQGTLIGGWAGCETYDRIFIDEKPPAPDFY